MSSSLFIEFLFHIHFVFFILEMWGKFLKLSFSDELSFSAVCKWVFKWWSLLPMDVHK